MDSEEAQAMLVLVAQVKDQATESMKSFVRSKSTEELIRLLGRYNEMNRSCDPHAVLDGTLAAYGLVCAIECVLAEQNRK